MNTPRKKIAVDLDDVLFQCVAAIFKYHNHYYQTKLKVEDQLVYGLSQSFGCSEAEFIDRVYKFYHSEYMEKMQPYPGALPALKKLQADFDLVVVTARPVAIETITKKAIATYFPGIFESVYLTNGFSKQGQKKLKSEICQQLGVTILIDDSPENALECAEKGIKVILFRRPWNSALKNKDLKDKNIYPANGWPEVVKIIHNL